MLNDFDGATDQQDFKLVMDSLFRVRLEGISVPTLYIESEVLVFSVQVLDLVIESYSRHLDTFGVSCQITCGDCLQIKRELNG
jgi:hypothetical protein